MSKRFYINHKGFKIFLGSVTPKEEKPSAAPEPEKKPAKAKKA